MLSLRSFARAAPRSISRLTSAASRNPTAFGIRASPSIARYAAPFSTSFARRQGNEELVAKLNAEYDVESNQRDDEEAEFNQTIKDYMSDSPFQIHDVPGQEEITLSRKYNDEEITVTFSIADLNIQQDPYEEDRALYDDSEDGELDSKSGRSATGEEESLDDEAEPPTPAYPVRVNVRVARDGKQGAVLIEASAEDGQILIENVYYFPDSSHAEPSSAEADYKRRNVYAGPPFGQLDEDLQVLLERFLEERGVDLRLAQFIPDYIDHKEQKEYLRWLQNLKGFFE